MSLPANPPALHVADDAPAALIARMFLRQQLTVWRGLEPAVRAAHDPEALHQLRVTGRRMVAILRMLEAASAIRSNRLRRAVRALMRRMNAARDLDVQIAEIGAITHSTLNGSLQPLLQRLTQRRTARQRTLLRLLDSPHCSQLIAALEGIAAAPRSWGNGPTIAQVAQRLLRKRYRKLRAAAAQVAARADVGGCHAMRLHAKKLRYTAEPLLVTYGKPMRRFLRRLRELQTLLGRINDANHALASLESYERRAAPTLSSAAALALERMAEQQERRLAMAVDALPGAWQRTAGRRWRRLRARLQDKAAGSQPIDSDSSVHSALQPAPRTGHQGRRAHRRPDASGYHVPSARRVQRNQTASPHAVGA
jgi:CHAD domain-containing protein